ncbi:MAG TPA: hypothetical protein VN681_07460 [Stellaceae bacterium]|nr:hypothetical protein [Stellaceae bacterium]
MADAVQTAASWQARTKKVRASPEIDRATTLLRVYHRVGGGDIDERRRLLTDLLATCRAYVKDRNLADPLFAAFTDLGMQADKQLKRIDKARHGWGQVRKVLGPSFSQHGMTKTVQNYSINEAKPTSDDNYWLEALDPRHRSWGHLDRSFFDQWMADATDKSFFDWLADRNLADMPGVAYLAPDQRWKYLCIFGDDRIMYRHQDALGARGKGGIPLERLSTSQMSTAHNGICFAIWVCSPGGSFYTASHKVSEFHHSSFLAGARVLAAGEWVFGAGKLLLITNKTGHYAASAANLYSALKLLDKRLDLSWTVVMVKNFTTNTEGFYTATEFLAKGGNTSACAPAQEGFDFKAAAVERCQSGQDWEQKMQSAPRAYSGGNSDARNLKPKPVRA